MFRRKKKKEIYYLEEYNDITKQVKKYRRYVLKLFHMDSEFYSKIRTSPYIKYSTKTDDVSMMSRIRIIADTDKLAARLVLNKLIDKSEFVKMSSLFMDTKYGYSYRYIDIITKNLFENIYKYLEILSFVNEIGTRLNKISLKDTYIFDYIIAKNNRIKYKAGFCINNNIYMAMTTALIYHLASDKSLYALAPGIDCNMLVNDNCLMNGRFLEFIEIYPEAITTLDNINDIDEIDILKSGEYYTFKDLSKSHIEYLINNNYITEDEIHYIVNNLKPNTKLYSIVDLYYNYFIEQLKLIYK